MSEKQDVQHVGSDVSTSSEPFKPTNGVLTTDQEANDHSQSNNVLSQYSEEQVMNMGRHFATKYELEDPELFAHGAALARRPGDHDRMSFLTEDERLAAYDEIHNKWKLPKKLWMIVAAGSTAAAVQGMDESVVNGANLFYPKGMGIGSKTSRDEWLQGLVNSAPYLCCAVFSCWLTEPLNKRFGRKKVIFWTSAWSVIACIWQALTNKWWHLFIARFCLGIAIGPNSSTVPIYSAECAPAQVRGALVMLWQFFTAFGIFLGYVFCLAFYKVPSHGIGDGGLNWRLMLGSALLPAVGVLLQVPFCPESPRWLMGKGRYHEAFGALKDIRTHKVLAARDLFYQHVLILEEGSLEMPYFQKFKELWTVRRNRNATVAALILTFMQQFCAINVIAYYSSAIFTTAGFSEVTALAASLGFGAVNFTFAIPAFLTIDKWGRRILLLSTFPLMGIFLFVTGFAFWIPGHEARIGVIAMGVYIFAAIYSVGEGPVPFTYSAECQALYVRNIGAAFTIGNTWFFNFILSITWPRLLSTFKPQGAFGYYAGWNFIGFFLILLFVPETKSLTLEELDEVFDVPAMVHAKYQWIDFTNWLQRIFLRRDIPRQPPLYRHERMAVTSEEWNDKPDVQVVE